jgi:hypothetical protein
MTPIIGDSFGRNGSAAIDISVPNRRILNSSIIKTIGIAASRGKLRPRPFRRQSLSPFFLLRNSNFPILTTSRKEPSHSSGLSVVIRNWIFSENISKSPKNLFTLMSGLKSSPSCIKFRSIWEKNWLPLFRTNYPLGFLQIFNQGKRCPDT